MIEMDYKPIRLCDTAKMPNDEWLKMREHGPHYDDPSHPDYIPVCIGGSTIASILGINPWVSPLEVWEKKKGNIPDNPDEVNIGAKTRGHIWEDFVAQMVPYLDGFSGAVVENDTGFFQHPYYPFACANLDRLITVNGEKAILEIKTTNWRNFSVIDKWKSGKVPLYYEYQCRWYMGIMNIDVAYIVCAWSFNTDDMAIIRIDRDKKIERFLFKTAAAFIKSIEDNRPPEMDGVNPDLVKESLKRLYNSDESLPPYIFSESDLYLFNGLKNVLSEKAEIDAQYKEDISALERRISFYENKICTKMKRHSVGVLKSGGKKYVVTYKTSRRKIVDSQRLKAEKPDIYEEYTKESLSRTLKFANEEDV